MSLKSTKQNYHSKPGHFELVGEETRKRPISLIVPSESVLNLKEGYSIIPIKERKVIVSAETTPEFLKSFYKVLNPIQGAFFLAIQKRFRESSFSSICSSPTSSGKTGIILLYMKHFLDIYGEQKQGPVIVYVSPLKALAREKYTEFQRAFGSENVEIKTGDQTDVRIKGKKILVATPDYLSLSIRNQVSFIENIRAIIVDEVHTLFGSQRVMDEVLWYVRESNIPFLFLSATIPLLDRMIDFYRPDFYLKSEWQPVPLEKEFIFAPKMKDSLKISRDYCPFVSNSCIRKCPLVNFDIVGKDLKANSNEFFRYVLLRLLVEIMVKNEGKKILLFTYSKSEGWNTLNLLNSICGFHVLNDGESVPFDTVRGEEGKPFSAFYCADLDFTEKIILEKKFRDDEKFSILISTSSLAYGVNLPADIAIVPVKYISNGSLFLPDIIDCIQMGGRAGRFGLSEKGKVYFVLRTSDTTAKRYLEDVDSYPYEKILANRENTDLLADLVLLAVKRGNNPFQIPSLSFYAHCLNFGKNVDVKIEDTLSRLLARNYLKEKDDQLLLTRKGEFCYRSGINPFCLERFLVQLKDLLKHDFSYQVDLASLSGLVFSGLEARSTFNSFVKTVITEDRNKDLIIDFITERIPCEISQKHPVYEIELKTKFITRTITGQYDLTPTQDGIRETFLSYIFLIYGIYFFYGLSKVYSDLSCLSFSAINYFIRNLLQFENEFNYISPSFIFYASHLFVHQLAGDPLMVFLAMKRYYGDNLRFGYFKKSLLALSIYECFRKKVFSKSLEFTAPKNVVKAMVSQMIGEKKNFMECAKKFVMEHGKNRKCIFKKNVNLERLENEFTEFAGKVESFLSACENGFLDTIEDHELYSTKVCTLIAKSLGKNFKSTDELKKYVHSFFTIKAMTISKYVV